MYVLYAIIQHFDLRFWYGDRLFAIWNIFTARFPGPLAQANIQGLFLVLALIAALRKYSVLNSTPWLISSILPLTGLLLTTGKMTYITIFLCTCLLLILHNKPLAFLKKVMFVLISSLFLYYAIQSFPVDNNPIESILSRTDMAGFQTRLIIWDIAFRMFSSHPWFGVGLSNMQAHAADMLILTMQSHPEWHEGYKLLSSGHMWAHNLPLQLSLELGVFGLLAAGMLYFHAGKNIITIFIHKRSALSESYIHGSVAGAAILLHGLVSVAAMQPFIMILFAVYMSASMHKNEG